ncbi:dTMP kinase [Candidatus Pelagibacter sp.]|nr:dTMP kinase [Candidatus Pelagibacter sp.]
MSKKPIIVFEGIEGSGKSHHIKKVANYLKKKKISFLLLREPGGNPNSEKIRKLILDKKSKFNKKTDLLLYLSSRSENIDILKKSNKKKVILIDRFIDSTIAYQHYGMDISLSLINTINQYILDGLKVNFTFLNTVNEKNMYQRLKKRKKLNRYDKFSASFYKKVQKGFIKISKKRPHKYFIVNSNLDIKKNELLIINKIQKLIR